MKIKSLQKNREELDQHELSEENLINAENAYLEMAELFDFIKINCIKEEKIRSIEEISDELYNKLKKML